MRVVVVGPGGVGGYVAAKLFQAGIDVVLVARGQHLAAIQAGGLSLEGHETFTAKIPIFRSMEECPRFDCVILAVKMTALELLLEANASFILANPQATVVTLQNGIDAEEIVARHLPENPIIGGVAYIDALVSRPGVVRVSAPGKFAMALWRGGDKSVLTRCLENFARAELEVRGVEQLAETKWRKLCWNAIFNPLAVITRLTVGEIKSDSALADLGHGLAKEIVEVAAAEGVKIPLDFIDGFFDLGDSQSSGVSTTRTSMWADFSAGKRTEVDFLNGAVCRRGRRHGIPTPLNDAVVALVHALERSAR